MSSDLTLPGTIPGLLRKCSPVHVDGRGGGVVVDKPGDKVGWFRVLCDGCEDEPDAESRSCVHLDLTDATGRAHAAWWLALREVPPSHHLDPAAVSWSRAPAQASFGWAMRWLARALAGDGSLTGSWWTGSKVSLVSSHLLADLDPADDRRLPDGSRWVDAEALRLVCLHVHAVNEASR